MHAFFVDGLEEVFWPVLRACYWINLLAYKAIHSLWLGAVAGTATTFPHLPAARAGGAVVIS